MKAIICACAALASLAVPALAGGMVEEKIKLFQFQPGKLEVKVGTTVKWANGDDIEHSVTAVEGAFDSGFLKKDGTFEFTFDKPGTYSYFCKRHPSMKGKVTVTE